MDHGLSSASLCTRLCTPGRSCRGFDIFFEQKNGEKNWNEKQVSRIWEKKGITKRYLEHSDVAIVPPSRRIFFSRIEDIINFFGKRFNLISSFRTK